MAKEYGYEFHPVKEHDDEVLSGGVDGTNSRVDQGGPSRECYVLARVVGGNMIAQCPYRRPGRGIIESDDFDDTRDFRMFTGKALAPGWIVRDIVVSGGTWIDRPEPGATSLEFSYRLTIAKRFYDRSTSARVTRIVLEGPASASSWEDAFKVN